MTRSAFADLFNWRSSFACWEIGTSWKTAPCAPRERAAPNPEENSSVPTGKLIGDAYLAAFSIAGARRMVTLDRGFRQFKSLDVEVLTRLCPEFPYEHTTFGIAHLLLPSGNRQAVGS
jgi:hypothetical protein